MLPEPRKPQRVRHKALPNTQIHEEKGRRADKTRQTLLPAGIVAFVIQKQLQEHLYRSAHMDVDNIKKYVYDTVIGFLTFRHEHHTDCVPQF